MELSKLGYQTKTINALAKRKIFTQEDLVRLLPRKYKDYRVLTHIENTQPGQFYAVPGTLRSVDMKVGNKAYLSVKVCADPPFAFGSEVPISVLFFSRTFLYRAMAGMVGKRVVIMGSVSHDPRFGFSMPEPDSVVLQEDWKPHIATVYPKIGGVSDAKLRELIEDAISRTHEPFEWELMREASCIDYKSALRAVHFPTDSALYKRGLSRLRLNDLLYFSLGLKAMQQSLPGDTALSVSRRAETDAFIRRLPFELTNDQVSVFERVWVKMSSGARLDMLLQGDVGSGKTVVGLAAASLAAENGMQAVLMAPRSVLAAQHLETAKELLGWPDGKIVFLCSGMKVSERKKALSAIKDGTAALVVGTHSCIAADVHYNRLGLVVTDEEHLFGVRQKEAIVAKATEGAHVISMSATPIPRTLATSIFGAGKEVAQITSMPKGRLPIKTGIVSEQAKIFAFINSEVNAGHQCYVVCPSIEESEDNDLVSVEETEKLYRQRLEPYGIRIGVANGKMPRADAESVVSSFAAGDLDVLISTTVIEVGVNVPKATVIVIEQAERFGLASLHQLRGRVGRSNLQSFCLLRTEEVENERLQTLCKTTDGFVIAEADYKQRGSGNLLGLKQSGSNRYIELMLSHPKLYKEAARLADFCIEDGFGGRLLALYPEKEGD